MDLQERVRKYGPSTLSDSDLLEMIVGNKKTAEDITTLCEGSLKKLYTLNREEFNGLSNAKYSRIVAAIELSKRKAVEENTTRKIVNTSKVSYDIFHSYMNDLNVENFYAMYLNQNNNFLGIKRISTGGITSTLADNRVILKAALDYKATGIIISHNHPSGSIIPSKADELITNKIKEAAAILDLRLLDHIIIGNNNGYYSFADEGVL